MMSAKFGADQVTRSCEVECARRLSLPHTACTTPSAARKMRADSAGREARVMVHCAPVVQARCASGRTASQADAGGMAGFAAVAFATCTAERTAPVLGVQPANPARTFSMLRSEEHTSELQS